MRTALIWYAMEDSPSGAPLQRGTGVTVTERYLSRLADRSFLTLWSYPAIYRDQGQKGAGHGKEVCDLLVVFENHILIFSDKDVIYGNSNDEDVNWARWYRKAIKESAVQVFGAERWIREHPDRLFLDPNCANRFPIALPDPQKAIFHRIVVAHDSSGQRRHLLGGTGSLMINPNIIGDQHLLKRANGGFPLAIGQVNPDRGYVHVLDDVALGLVLGTLDTITDFVWYLEKKERLIRSERLLLAAGEEDLLAYYLKILNERGEHDFVMPPDDSKIVIEEGHFLNFMVRPAVIAKRKADEISFLWDHIIEEFAEHVRGGTLYQTNDPTLAAQECILRLLAREPRLRRRMLSRAVLEKLKKTPANSYGCRTIAPSNPGDAYFVFVCVPLEWGPDEPGYRVRRVEFVKTYCSIVMMQHPEAPFVVGIGTESGLDNQGRSHDLILMDRQKWTVEDEARTRKIQSELGFMRNVRMSGGVEREYPVDHHLPASHMIGRNDPCPCGSGMKYKKCCGGTN